MKKPVPMIPTLVLALLLAACTGQTTPPDSALDGTTSASTAATTHPSNDASSAADTTAPLREPVGDGIYRIDTLPPAELNALACAYGTTYRYEGAKAEVYGQTLDFSALPDRYDSSVIPYCVRNDLSTVYYADYLELFQTDMTLQNPRAILQMSFADASSLAGINELIAFENTDLLFFQGSTQTDACIGSIHPETGAVDWIPAAHHYVSVPCNTGVMLYDHEEAKTESSTVLYWECGEFFRIPLQKPMEADVSVSVSANGKYICSVLWGKTQDNHLVERYSVYDVKSGTFLKSFDWTFRGMFGDTQPSGFSAVSINEANKCVYALNREDMQLYQFAFGEDQS